MAILNADMRAYTNFVTNNDEIIESHIINLLAIIFYEHSIIYYI